MTLSNDNVLKQKLLSLYPKSSYLSYWLNDGMSLDYVVKRLLAAEHLREDFSVNPKYSADAQKMARVNRNSQIDYWIDLQASQRMLNRRPGKSFTADDLVGEVAE